MAKTLHDRYLAALMARGETIAPAHPCATGKYTKVTRKAGGFYFIGHSGALRFGANSTTSRPVSDLFKEKLLSA